MANTSLAQPRVLNNTQETEQQNIEFILEDGIHYNPDFNEYEVVVDGETVAWADTQGQAYRSYHELLRVQREHVERNPDNAAILVNWPDGVTVLETDVAEWQTYGLEAVA